MAIKSSGPISFSEISQEFGSSTGGISISLGKYRVSQTFGGMQNMPLDQGIPCLLYTSPSPRDATLSRMPSSA